MYHFILTILRCLPHFMLIVQAIFGNEKGMGTYKTALLYQLTSPLIHILFPGSERNVKLIMGFAIPPMAIRLKKSGAMLDAIREEDFIQKQIDIILEIVGALKDHQQFAAIVGALKIAFAGLALSDEQQTGGLFQLKAD